MADEQTYDEQLSGKWGVGTRLIIAAWLVEIAAAAIGVFIAFLTIHSAREQAIEVSGSISFANEMNAFLGGIPFMMVAVIELCKIPLATAYFHAASLFWRGVFLFGLSFLLIITFETMLNGFERFLATQTLAISETRDAADLLRKKSDDLQIRIAELQELSPEAIRSAHEGRISQIQSSRTSELQEIANAVANAQATYGDLDTSGLQSSLERVDRDIENLEQAYQSEISVLSRKAEQASTAAVERSAKQLERAENILQSARDRIDQLRREIRDLNQQEDKELNDTFFGTDSVRKKFAERREPLERELETLLPKLSAGVAIESASLSTGDNSEIDKARNHYNNQREKLVSRRSEILRQIQSAANKTDAALKPVLENLETRRANVTEKYEAQSELATQRFNEQMEELKSREDRVKEFQFELQNARDELQERRTEITRLAKDNQVYRVARWFFDKENAADLTQREINITTLIWFGSLAAITAWTGTLLAFGGLVVKFGHRRLPRPSIRFEPIKRFFRSLRYLVIALRQRAREPKIVTVENQVVKTVEITKEVPVDRVVVKEVPVEVVRKEIVYVPLLTDEEDIIHKQSDLKVAD